jgi:hypothetical protein
VCTFAALFVAMGAAASAHSQTPQSVRIAGHAIDPQGQPLSGLEVLLHRVDGAGGASLGSATTDSTGAFSIAAEAVADTQAVYFAAARLDGQLYIGPFVRDPDGSTPYMLVVGGEPVSLGPALPQTTSMPPVSPGGGPRRQLLVLLPLLALLGVAGWALAKSARTPARRRTLARMAIIDEEIEQGADDPQLEADRRRLMEQLLSD